MSYFWIVPYMLRERVSQVYLLIYIAKYVAVVVMKLPGSLSLRSTVNKSTNTHSMLYLAMVAKCRILIEEGQEYTNLI